MIRLDSQIEKHLECSICEEKYEDPRTVPCGKSFCKKCIESFSDINQSTFKCVCAKKHVIPENGEFPVNELLVLLLEKNTVKISPVQLSDDSKRKLSEIKQKINQLNFGINSSKDSIKNYIDKIRVEVDLTTETIIQNVQNQRDKLLLELKVKEESYIKNLDENSKNKQDVSALIKELENLLDDFENKSSYFKLDEREISKSINGLSLKISECQHELHKYLFKEDKLFFDKDMRTSENLTIGKIICKPSNLSIDLDNLWSQDIRNITILQADFDFYTNGDILFCYKSSNKRIECKIIEKNTERMVNHKYLDEWPVYICSLRCFVHKSDRYVILMVNLSDKTSEITVLHPKSLHILSRLDYSVEAIDVHLNTDFIYLLLKTDICCVLTVDILDPGSQIKKYCMIKNSALNSATKCFQVNNRYIFGQKNDSTLSICDIIKPKINISKLVAGKFCTIYNDSFIVTYNSKERCIYYYDFDGSYAGNQQIPDDIEPTVIKCKNDRILFYDEKNFTIYYTKND